MDLNLNEFLVCLTNYLLLNCIVDVLLNIIFNKCRFIGGLRMLRETTVLFYIIKFFTLKSV